MRARVAAAAARGAAGQSPNPSLVTPCAAYCDAVVAKGCANTPPKAECNTNCQWAGATGLGCDAQWKSFLECANGSTLTCVLGYASSIACGAEWKVFNKCVNQAGG